MSISTNNRIYVKLQKTYHILYYISKCDVSKLSYLSITKICQAAQGTCKKIIDIISLAYIYVYLYVYIYMYINMYDISCHSIFADISNIMLYTIMTDIYIYNLYRLDDSTILKSDFKCRPV